MKQNAIAPDLGIPSALTGERPDQAKIIVRVLGMQPNPFSAGAFAHAIEAGNLVHLPSSESAEAGRREFPTSPLRATAIYSIRFSRPQCFVRSKASSKSKMPACALSSV